MQKSLPLSDDAPAGPDERAGQGLADSEGRAHSREHYRLLLQRNWGIWAGVLLKFDLDGLTLGQISSSLQLLPESLWPERLSPFLQLTPEQIGKRFEGEPGQYIAFVRAVQRLSLYLSRELRSKPHPKIFRSLRSRFAEQMNQAMQALFLRQDFSRSSFDLQIVIPILNELGDHLDQEPLAQASARLGLSEAEAAPAELGVIPPALRILWPEGAIWFVRFCEYHRRMQGQTDLNAYLCQAGELLFGPESL